MRSLERAPTHLDPTQMDWPPVSVVMALGGDEHQLRSAVREVLSQDYPGRLELVVALGPAGDHTGPAEDTIREIAAADARVRLVDNPAGSVPAGLNAAVAAARFGVLVRVDGQTLLGPGYIRRSVLVLETTGAHNVGGVVATHGDTPCGEAVAKALTLRLGVGGTHGTFRAGGPPGPVDTVHLGVLRRHTLDDLGGYDETLLHTQDWELNRRIREAGGTVWFTPELRVVHRSRPTLRPLAVEMYRNGRWRQSVGRRHRGTLGLRHVAPPVAVATFVGCVLAAVTGALVGVPALVGLLGVPGLYLLGLTVGAAYAGRDLPRPARRWLPLVLLTMHMTWGTGYLVGLSGQSTWKARDSREMRKP